MQATPLEQKIVELISPSVGAMGYDLVRVKVFDQAKRQTTQIMAERKDGVPMTVDDCEKISHQVSAVLDVEDPIADPYDLEVSSPGIDRPLVREQDFITYKGYEAKLETRFPIEGRKRYRGFLKGIEQGVVTIEVDTVDYHLPFVEIAQAKLVLTDALLKAHQEAAKKHGLSQAEGGEMDVNETTEEHE